MNRAEYEFLAKISEIDRADTWLQEMVEGCDFCDTSQFLFAAHELIINSVEAVLSRNSAAAEERIRICLTRSEKGVSLTVTDDGGGISQEMIDHASLENLDVLEERGRGLALIREWTQSFTVSREEDGRYSYSIIAKHRE